ncbi:MAG TPA: PadR family transcriptional regulator [Acidimicrobiia bacterium]|nr:PadR family transcriptional regulator [Acidimicrobiia bacterium]
MPVDPDQLENHVKEIRRGSLILACLLALREPGYGYGLLEKLEQSGVEVDANTLYPMLRRLEKQGLLVSEWDTDGARPRKYYATSDKGRDLADELIAAWSSMTESLEQLEKGAS